jgi:hypothetical protein
MDGDDLTKPEWDARGDAQWRDILKSEWEKPYVSLSAIVYWISAKGEPRECDFDELNAAAKILAAELREGGKLAGKVKGYPSGKAIRETAPCDAFANIPTFFDDGSGLQSFWEIGVAYLEWDQDLEDGRGDVITDRCDAIHWRGLSIDKADLLELWPVQRADAERSPALEETALAGANRRRAWKVDALARALSEHFPVRPGMTNGELARAIRAKEPRIGTFSQRSLITAKKMVYG